MTPHLDSLEDAAEIAFLLNSGHVALYDGYAIKIVCTMDGRTVAVVE